MRAQDMLAMAEGVGPGVVTSVSAFCKSASQQAMDVT